MKEDLSVDKGVIANEQGFNKNNFNVDKCDVVFIKQLGKIYNESDNFLNFLNIMEGYNGRTLNEIETIKNNLSKQYLLDLYENNFPVIPTKKFNKNLGLNEAKKISFERSIEEMVIKPLVFGEQGQSVRQLNSFETEEEFKNYKQKNNSLIVQPLIKGIFDNGENSLIFLDKNFAHSINKYSGRFKINAATDTVWKKHNPSKEEFELCERILDYWPNKLGYTRIDLIPSKGKYLISEVETINPNFYIENVNGLGEKFLPKLEKFLEERK